MKKDLDLLLNEAEPEARKEEPEITINDLQITKSAFDKAFAYARIVCEVAEDELECIGYLITPKNAGDRVVRNVFFARDQEISAAAVELSAQDVIKAGREIDSLGYRVLGWWHSHAGFGTFHSGTDDGNQMTVLNQIAPFNYISRIKERQIRDLETSVVDGKTVLLDRKNPGVKYELEGRTAFGLDIARLRIVEEERIGFAYSLVVNNNKKSFGSKLIGLFGVKEKPAKPRPYAEIATREYCMTCNKCHDDSDKARVQFVNGPVEAIDEEAMRKEVKAKIKMPRRFVYIPGFSGGGNYGGIGSWKGYDFLKGTGQSERGGFPGHVLDYDERQSLDDRNQLKLPFADAPKKRKKGGKNGNGK